ncbi:MAG: bacillithiol biosynthesis cysteine-adding enzyme BshC [Balneolales bacterium]|nr:bacillithiol biosynthesis cysteine-adding enzyme BshC [Balneolales bacterium]
MQLHSVSYEELGGSKLFLDYVGQRIDFKDYYSGLNPFVMSSWGAQSNRLKQSGIFKANPNEVSDAIFKINKDFGASAETLDSISQLRNKNTFTIVAGQQAGLLGGPLFTLNKIVTLISVSRYCREKLGLKVIPVFWVADEDHDFDEVSFTTLINPYKELIRVELDSPNEKIKPPMGSVIIPEQIKNLISACKKAGIEGCEVCGLLDFWKAGEKWINAFCGMLLHLFKDDGLVVLTTVNEEMKLCSRPFFEQVIRNHSTLVGKIKDQSQKLDQIYHQQAYTGDSLLFYSDDNLGRVKLEFEDGNWSSPVFGGNRVLDNNEFINFLDEHNAWHKLSPNVFLRPMLQQFLLPNLAYFGGAAEIAYHAQIKSAFQKLKLVFPLILPRLSATVVEESIGHKMDNFSFSFSDYAKQESLLHKSWLQNRSFGQKLEGLAQIEEDILKAFESRPELFEDYDESVKISVASTSKRMLNEVDSLRKKVFRAEKKKETVGIERLSVIQRMLFPEQQLQERSLAWISLLSRNGLSMIQNLEKEIGDDPFQYLSSHQLIRL